MPEPRVFYFGCWDGVGHHLHEQGGRSVPGRDYGEVFSAMPKLDGGYTPRTSARQGAAKLTHLDGWTVLAWHDYSIDSREKSNSAVIAEGRHSYAAMMGFLAYRFPSVMARQPASITIAEGDPTA